MTLYPSGTQITLEPEQNAIVKLDDWTPDDTKAEIRVRGRRYGLLDITALCQHLDACLGTRVGEVIMRNHRTQLGKETVNRIRQSHPGISIHDIVKMLTEEDQFTGIGTTKLGLPENPLQAGNLTVWDPIVVSTAGAAKAFISSYWAGVLSELSKLDFEPANIRYDEDEKLLTCRLSPKDTLSLK